MGTIGIIIGNTTTSLRYKNLIAAGLMFVLMHGEVNAEDMKKIKCESFETGQGDFTLCKIHQRSSPDFIKEDLTCVFVHAPTFTSSFLGTSCMKS